MNNPTNMAELFNKLNDLKSVFKYGERLIPVIQGLVDFMRDTVPLLEKINTSIAESTNKIPKATNQINNVTSATELATTEILDLVDTISNDVTRIEKVLIEITSRENEKKELRNKILADVASLNGTGELLNRYFELTDIAAVIEPVHGLFGKIRDDAYNITMSLQVQDITSQQLAAVNHLIESVQSKLASLLFNFQESNLKANEIQNIEISRDSAFNPDARYIKADEQQQMADSLIKSGSVAQDEIDKLFS